MLKTAVEARAVYTHLKREREAGAAVRRRLGSVGQAPSFEAWNGHARMPTTVRGQRPS